MKFALSILLAGLAGASLLPGRGGSIDKSTSIYAGFYRTSLHSGKRSLLVKVTPAGTVDLTVSDESGVAFKGTTTLDAAGHAIVAAEGVNGFGSVDFDLQFEHREGVSMSAAATGDIEATHLWAARSEVSFYAREPR